MRTERVACATLMLLLCGAALLGCDDSNTDAGVSNSETGGMNGELLEPDAGFPVPECPAAKSRAEYERQTEVAYELEASLHEMVACGGLTFTLVNALVGVFEALIVSGRDLTLPPGFAFAAGGLYTTGPVGFGETRMEVRVFDASGALLEENLFDLESYLVGARVQTDTSDPLAPTASITFDAPGPLVRLLGYGDTPPNPIVVGLADADRLTAGLRAASVETSVLVEDARDHADVHYRVDSPRAVVSSLLSDSLLDVEVVEVAATRTSTEQALAPETWAVRYVDEAGGALDGSATFTATGGAFPFTAAMVWDHNPRAEVTITCAP